MSFKEFLYYFIGKMDKFANHEENEIKEMYSNPVTQEDKSETSPLHNQPVICKKKEKKKSIYTKSVTSESDMTQDLMMLVGKAIDEWARKYNMEKLPKKIIFQQALSILNVANNVFYNFSERGDG